MKSLIAVLCVCGLMSVCAEETKYPYILDAITQYKKDYSDTNSLQVIFETARSDDHEAVITHCMAIYTLHMGKENQASVCQGGYKAILTRYPDSDIARQMQVLSLFPDACSTCKGLGVVQKQSVSSCSSCLNSGLCGKCGGTGRVRHGGVGLRGPVPKGSHINSTTTFYPTDRNVIYRSRQRNYSRASNSPATLPQVTIPCSICRGTGQCPLCYGEPQKARMINVRCPTCNGIAKGINNVIAKSALSTICENTADLLNRAINCENAFLEICEDPDQLKQQKMLTEAIKTHEKAFNIDLLFGLKEEIDTQVAILRQDAKEAAKKLIQEHKALFDKIRSLSNKQIALEEINAFLVENPDSPLRKDFELYAKELHQQSLQLRRDAERKRRWRTGLIAIVVVILALWFLTSFRVTWVRYVFVGKRKQPGASKRKLVDGPMYLASSETSGATPITIYPKHPFDYETDVVTCPECGALLGCAKNLVENRVICSECKKPFIIH